MFTYIWVLRARRTGDLDLNSQPNWSERMNERFRSISASNRDKTGLSPSPLFPPRHNRRAFVTSCRACLHSLYATHNWPRALTVWFRKAPVIASERYRDRCVYRRDRILLIGWPYLIKVRFLPVHEVRLSTCFMQQRNIYASLITFCR